MTSWSAEELARIATADDLHVAPYRADGITLGTPTWIWSVMVDGHLFIRPYNGLRSHWYQAAVTQQAGQVTTGGRTYDVGFTPADPTLSQAVDDGLPKQVRHQSLPAAHARGRTTHHHPRGHPAALVTAGSTVPDVRSIERSTLR